MERNNKKKSLVIVLFVIFVAIAIVSCIVVKKKNTNTTLAREATIKDDFYEFVNKDILDNKELDSDKPNWNCFTDAQEVVDGRIDEIVKEIISKKGEYEEGTTEYKICQLYDSAVNLDGDMSTIDYYIEMIDDSENIDEFVANAAKINEEIQAGLIINKELLHDLKDKTKIMISINQFEFDYGIDIPEFYTNEQYSKQYLPILDKYDVEILKTYGYSDEKAKESVEKLDEMYKVIAKKTKTQSDFSNIQERYNVVSHSELEEIFSNIDINLFLEQYGDEYIISVLDVEQAKAVNEYLTEQNLDTLKEYAKLRILQVYAGCAKAEYRDIVHRLDAEMNGTEVTKDTLEDEAIDTIKSYFNDEISQMYVEKYNDEENIEEFKNMINDIIDEYKTKLASNSWLSESTKEKAMLKLDKMTINVAYPDKWMNPSKDYELSESLMNNVINMKNVYKQYSEESLINNEGYWDFSILDVNAYYNPQDNSINFPIALLAMDVYDKNNTYYQNLGAFGSIIGHEISHAFDNSGALFDEKGNLNNWWQEEDYKKFEGLQQSVIDYYNQYEINGQKVNGKQTVGENIADLGGVSCIVSIAKNKGASNEDLKQLFESYANVWASKSTPQYQAMMMLQDTHSPNKIRVNAVLSSIDEFYEVYEITENDGMFKAIKDRIKVW